MREPYRLLVVLAHPDDESLACGGTIARSAAAGVEVTLVCATRGEAGSADPALQIPPGRLGEARTAELEAACRVLGVSRLEWLDLQDGMLPWLSPQEVAGGVQRIADRIGPHAVITFGRDGLYWHPDHIAVFERTREAVNASAACRGTALYGVTLPPRAMTRIAKTSSLQTGRTGVSFWGVSPAIFGKGAPGPTLVVDVHRQLTTKIAALQCHRSQLAPPNPLRDLLPEAPHDAFAVEHFHLLDPSPLDTSFLQGLSLLEPDVPR